MGIGMTSVAVIKLGCIGTSPLLDLLLDERADREDLRIRAFSSGPRLDLEAGAELAEAAVAFAPDLILVVSPNAVLPGPKRAREICAASGLPTIALGDAPSRKAFFTKDEAGKQVEAERPDNLGFIIITPDPMLGARRQFLDPSEMALFNGDVIKVLAATGVLRVVQEAIDGVIHALDADTPPELPALVVGPEIALEHEFFANPYAAAKAFAALKIAESVAAVTGRACFAEKDAARYVPMAAGAHEMLRAAASLADSAREIEKAGDTVARAPHAADGSLLAKRALAEAPS